MNWSALFKAVLLAGSVFFAAGGYIYTLAEYPIVAVTIFLVSVFTFFVVQFYHDLK